MVSLGGEIKVSSQIDLAKVDLLLQLLAEGKAVKLFDQGEMLLGPWNREHDQPGLFGGFALGHEM